MSDNPGPVSADTQSIPLSDARRWRAYWVCVGVAALTILDVSKVNVALPAISTAFAAGSTELQLVISGYVLTFGLVLVPMGRLGDQRSRRALFIIGLSLFTLTSLAGALATDATMLLTARLLQGVAAGIQMPQVMGLIQQLFTGSERGKAFGLLGATIGIATAFGPTLGGLAIAIGGPTDGWRGIFWMNVPLGIIAIAATIWLLPSTRTRSHQHIQLDPIGILLFGSAILCAMWPFLFTTGSPDDDPARWWLLVPFVLIATGFVLWERWYAGRGKQPLIPLQLFRISSFRNGTLLTTAYFTGMPAVFVLTTLYLQEGLGIEAVFAGMVTIGFAVASAASSWLGGLWVNRLGRPLVVWGLVIMVMCTAGLVLVAQLVPPEATPLVMAGTMALGGFGAGIVQSPNQTLTLADVSVKHGGLAGSVGQLGQRVGNAVGIAIAIALFYSTIFRESDHEPPLVVFRDAYTYSMAAAGVFIVLALIVALVDLNSRKRQLKQSAV